MTNIRIATDQAYEWLFCPYCGRKTELDQSDDGLIRTDGDIDYEASEEAGFDFGHSVRHCDVHIRLWIPDNGTDYIV